MDCCRKRQKVSPKNTEQTTPPANNNHNNNDSKIIKVNPVPDTEVHVDDDDKPKEYSWKEIALILDKCFMYTFIFLLVGTTLTCLGILIANF